MSNHIPLNCYTDEMNREYEDNERKQAPKFSITILWGQALRKDEPDTYEFDTEKELEAFLHGVNESSGWMEYDILCEMSDGTWENSDGTRMVVTSDGVWEEEEEDGDE